MMRGMGTIWLWGAVGLMLIAASTILLRSRMDAAGTAEPIPFWRGVAATRTWLVVNLALLGLAMWAFEAAFGSTLIAALVTLAAWAVGYELIRRLHNRHVAASSLIGGHSA
jgi:hypothetical protein